MENIAINREAYKAGVKARELLAAGGTLKAAKLLVSPPAMPSIGALFARAMPKGRKSDFIQALNLSLDQIRIALREGGQLPPRYGINQNNGAIIIRGYFDPTDLRSRLMRIDDGFKEILDVGYVQKLYHGFFAEAQELIRSEYPNAVISFYISKEIKPDISIACNAISDQERIKEIIQIAWECGDWHALKP
ncbi:hypothetical protein ACJVQT_22900 [Enterobacter huaxiensis]|uniref:hypothetical protein n=1 Tax=Enterobacter huaxiensis TaxID=2494702 RepID=UPI002175FB9E|nr:hypothetical protein [Enterobacter huaxiensis]MCS5452516.1 hypothetical protein [Enterobacter huaxiensis]